MSKQIAKDSPNRGTQSFGPGDLNLEKVDDVVDEHFESKADFYRTAVSEKLAEFDDTDTDADPNADLHKPDHPELREAFEELLELSNHPHGSRRVSVEEAKSKLHTRECPKSQVVDRLLIPLENEGFATARAGYITVHRRTVQEVEAAEAEAEEELDDIGLGHTLPSQRDITDEQKEIRKYRTADLGLPFRLSAWVASETLWSNDGGISA